MISVVLHEPLIDMTSRRPIGVSSRFAAPLQVHNLAALPVSELDLTQLRQTLTVVEDLPLSS